MTTLKNGTIISKPNKARRAQRGDAHVVVVFHTSGLGVMECMADVDVIVNDGKDQPDCKTHQKGRGFCNHFAAFILRELIIKIELPTDCMNSSLSGIERQDGHPVIYQNIECAASFGKKEGCERERFPIVFTNPPKQQKGTYHMHTAAVFGTQRPETKNQKKKAEGEITSEESYQFLEEGAKLDDDDSRPGDERVLIHT